MPRTPKPWRRGGPSGPWYCQHDRRKVFLAPGTATKTEANRALFALLAAPRRSEKAQKAQPADTLGSVIRWWLARLAEQVKDGSRKPATLEVHTSLLRSADAAMGKIPVTDLRETDVRAWVNGAGWNQTSRATAVAKLLACLNWAVRTRLIPANPIHSIERPRELVRARVVTPAEADELRAAIKPADPLKDLYDFIRWTGCRQIEARSLTAAMVRPDGTVEVPTKRTKTGRDTRTIVLSPEAEQLVRRLAQEHPDGPVFRTEQGRPWQRGRITQRFRDLVAAAGVPKGAGAHGLRHCLTSDLLAAGVPPSTAAALLGNSTAVLLRVYDRSQERTDALREALAKVNAPKAPEAAEQKEKAEEPQDKPGAPPETP